MPYARSIKKRAKGVKKSVVKEKIQFDDYLQCFNQHCELKREQKTFRSIKHNVYSIEQRKIALNPCDDKRYIKPKQSDTLAWGHYRISNMCEKK